MKLHHLWSTSIMEMPPETVQGKKQRKEKSSQNKSGENSNSNRKKVSQRPMPKTSGKDPTFEDWTRDRMVTEYQGKKWDTLISDAIQRLKTSWTQRDYLKGLLEANNSLQPAGSANTVGSKYEPNNKRDQESLGIQQRQEQILEALEQDGGCSVDSVDDIFRAMNNQRMESFFYYNNTVRGD